MSKTLYQASKEFNEAWHDFCLALAYSLKADKVLDFSANRFRALKEWLDARQSL